MVLNVYYYLRLMNIVLCRQCGIPVKQTPGKKKKTFCSPKCRQNHWQKTQQEMRRQFKELGPVTFSESTPKQPGPLRLTPPSADFSYDYFEQAIRETTYSGDLEKIMAQIDSNAFLGAAYKARLRAIANQHRHTFTN